MQERTNYSIASLCTLAASVAVGAALILPFSAAAATIVPAVTAQQLVQGAPNCTAPIVTDVTPYIYGGDLNAFEVTISNPQYIALAGAVGDTGIPFNYITRRNQGGSSAILMHVDLPSTPVTASLPVSLTLLSSQPGQGICAATVTFTLHGQAPAAPSAPTTPAKPSTPTTSTSQPSTTSGSPANSWTPATTSSTTATSVAAISGSILATPLTGLSTTVKNICASSQGAYELWLTLLAIYFVFVVSIVFADIPSFRASTLVSAVLILLPLAALLAFWYLMPVCRTDPWTTIGACLVAVGGLIGLFQEGTELPLLTTGSNPGASKES